MLGVGAGAARVPGCGTADARNRERKRHRRHRGTDIWQCAGGTWMEVQDAGITASAFELSSVNHDAPLSSEGIVTIQMPNAIRGASGNQLRVQAVAAGESKVALLPASGTGNVISLIFAGFADVSVAPMVARPGQTVTITANGLPASRAVDIFVADVKAGPLRPARIGR